MAECHRASASRILVGTVSIEKSEYPLGAAARIRKYLDDRRQAELLEKAAQYREKAVKDKRTDPASAQMKEVMALEELGAYLQEVSKQRGDGIPHQRG